MDHQLLFRLRGMKLYTQITVTYLKADHLNSKEMSKMISITN
nr:MAG TPA: hypothetical protein [Bacteriophage sp.]DAQ90475.1 MAG TPA: hypothetical protein [Caudoviricetes sp.]DAV67092.1 MAG TPA: hypothetical protein [Caudoviricetes sp.]